MSKYDVDKDGAGTCAFCEKPLATDAEKREWDKRWLACDAELNAWADQFCWYRWSEPGECRNGMSIEKRLIEVLEQRNELRQHLQEIQP